MRDYPEYYDADEREDNERRSKEMQELYDDAIAARGERDQWVRYAMALEAAMVDRGMTSELAALRKELF